MNKTTKRANTTMKTALRGIALVLALAACGTAAFGQALKTPYLIYQGTNTDNGGSLAGQCHPD